LFNLSFTFCCTKQIMYLPIKLQYINDNAKGLIIQSWYSNQMNKMLVGQDFTECWFIYVLFLIEN